MSEWQPIETAPKDGTEIILRKKHRVGAAAWVHWTEEFEAAEGWTVGLDGNKWGDPTHWMPLPAAPALPSPKDVVELSLADAQMLLSWMDETFGNDDGVDWTDEGAAAVGDALGRAIENFNQMRAALPSPGAEPMPVDMILYCPNCGAQHVDAPEDSWQKITQPDFTGGWNNPPHRSHLCHGCGCIWRPADVPTNGVADLVTQGKADTWPSPHNDEVTAMPAAPQQPASDTPTSSAEVTDEEVSAALKTHHLLPAAFNDMKRTLRLFLRGRAALSSSEEGPKA